MGDDDRRSRKFQQGRLEDLLGVNVQVVGRLVQYEGVCSGKHQLQQGQSCLFSSGKASHRQENIIAAEKKSPQYASHLRIRIKPV